MPISKEKSDGLTKRMNSLGIFEEDLLEKFILGSGRGGQAINKTASCVYLKHLPSNIEVKCQKGRSQAMNRYYARKELCDKIEEIVLKEKSAKQQEREKIKRQKKRRSRKQKEKILADKKHHSLKKDQRRVSSKEFNN
ncbi:MAG: peptide chain release factor-like protein [Parachlamydiales bacterium]|nr:peptide chain release factor-like protein [Parachlamydiales bacterium]